MFCDFAKKDFENLIKTSNKKILKANVLGFDFYS